MTGLNPEQLRETIVRAAMPLMNEYLEPSMAQIARAAGIGEDDLRTVFADTEAVLQACIAMATASTTAILSPAEELRQLDAIRTDQPLAVRLVKAINIFDAYYQRVRADIDALKHGRVPGAGRTDSDAPQYASVPGVDAADPPGARPFSRENFRAIGRQPEVRQAVAKLLEPEQQRLSLPAEVLSDAFLGMSLSGIRLEQPEQSPLPAEQIVYLFLHGALNTG